MREPKGTAPGERERPLAKAESARTVGHAWIRWTSLDPGSDRAEPNQEFPVGGEATSAWLRGARIPRLSR